MSERYFLWPMAQVDGEWSAPDEVWAQVWGIMVKTGRAERLFYNGYIRTYDDWLAWVKDRSNLVVLVVDSRSKKFACVAWLNNISEGAAQVHFCFLESLPRPEIGKLVLSYWSGLPGIHVIIGLTPESHPTAVKYAEKMGFTIQGIIPSFCNLAYEGRRVGAVVSSYPIHQEVENGWRKEAIDPAAVAV